MIVLPLPAGAALRQRSGSCSARAFLLKFELDTHGTRAGTGSGIRE